MRWSIGQHEHKLVFNNAQLICFWQLLAKQKLQTL